jgi:hypothetical protein
MVYLWREVWFPLGHWRHLIGALLTAIRCLWLIELEEVILITNYIAFLCLTIILSNCLGYEYLLISKCGDFSRSEWIVVHKNAPSPSSARIRDRHIGNVGKLVFANHVVTSRGVVERRGRMVRTSDSQPEGRGFESRRRHGVVSVSRIP